MTHPPTVRPSRFGPFAQAATIAFVIVSAVWVLARLWRLSSSCLWFDEVFSVHTARHSWTGMLKFVAADIIHPPFFYAVLKVWIAIGGESVLWLRLLPVLFSVATIVPVRLLAKELKLKPAETNLALLLMAVSAFQIKYAQILRMYTLLLFLSTLSIWLVLRFLRIDSRWKTNLAWLSLVNLLLVYTHYYGWVLLAIECIIVLIYYRRQFVLLLLSTAVAVLAYVPWIYLLAVSKEGGGLAQNIGWIDRPGWRDVIEYFVVFTKPFLFSQSTAERPYEPLTAWLVLVLIIVPIVFVLRWLFRDPATRSTGVWLVTLAFAPVLIAIVFSWILPYPVWGTRHLIIGSGPYFMLAAIGIVRLHPYWLRMAAYLLLGCWLFLAGAITVMRPPPKLTWCSWEGLLQQAPREDTRTPIEVYAFEDLVAYHLWFAGTTTHPGGLKVTVVKSVSGVSEDPFFLPRRFNEIKVVQPSQIQGEHVWLAFRAARWDETAAPLSMMKSLGYETGRVFSITAQGEQSFLVELRRSN